MTSSRSPRIIPDFAQMFDKSRPHELMTENPAAAGSLEYRFSDTGETVSVPNIWYTQTAALRAQSLRGRAAQVRERAERYECNPPRGYSKQYAEQEARRYRNVAAALEAKAAWMLKAVRRPELEAVPDEPELDLFFTGDAAGTSEADG